MSECSEQVLCQVEDEKTKFHISLQAIMYYFVYHINTIALYWQEKSTLLMNENKRINLTEWCKRQVTCQQLIGNIKHTWKNIVIFHVCCYGFSQGWKSLYNTLVYVIKGCFNGPFYSCVFGCQVFEQSESKGDLVLIQRMLLLNVNYLVIMLTRYWSLS